MNPIARSRLFRESPQNGLYSIHSVPLLRYLALRLERYRSTTGSRVPSRHNISDTAVFVGACEERNTYDKAHPVNIVLVHGGFVDGSGWEGVHAVLKKDGYRVNIVQNPTTSLADDVAVTKRTLAQQDGPAILVGHSYGGVVITEAGTDPRVLGLVYIAAFAPDAGESVASLIKNPPPGAPVPPILPPQDGYLFLDAEKFHASFAADVDAEKAAFMADSQVPWGLDALGGSITVPAWKTKPSWYLVATEDRMIPPPAQRAMATRAGATVIETPGSHSVYVSQPGAVAGLIQKAAESVAAVTR